jgi:hypothetical protein
LLGFDHFAIFGERCYNALKQREVGYVGSPREVEITLRRSFK